MAVLPPEILDQVFELFCVDASKSLQYNLASLALVCRSWSYVAKEKLYKSLTVVQHPLMVLLGTTNTYDDDLERAWRLARTLEGSLQLAMHVRRLKISFYKRQRHWNEDTLVEPSLKLIGLCPKLTHLTIDDFSGFDFICLRNTIAVKRDLEYVRLYSRDMEKKTLFADANGMLQMMRCWPNIKEMAYNDYTSARASPCYIVESPMPALPSANIILPLRKLELTASLPLRSKSFAVLSTLSLPYLELFSATLMVPASDSGIVIDCFEKWAPTLRELGLYDMYNSKVENDWAASSVVRLADVLKSMENLVVLAVSRRFIGIEDILTLKRVTVLSYYFLTQDQADIIADALEERMAPSLISKPSSLKPRWLPSLKVLSFDHFDVLDYSRCFDACRTRSIALAEMKWGGRYHHSGPWWALGHSIPDVL